MNLTDSDTIAPYQESDKCDCVPYTECDNFLQDAASLSSLRLTNISQYKLGVNRLAAMVCRQRQKMVCCQDRVPGNFDCNFML